MEMELEFLEEDGDVYVTRMHYDTIMTIIMMHWTIGWTWDIGLAWTGRIY